MKRNTDGQTAGVRPAGRGFRLWRDLRREAPNYVMMAPYLLFFVTCSRLPVILWVVLGFTNFNMLQPPEFVGWDNFLRMFLDDSVFLTALKNTLIFACVTGPVGYVLCFMFAWLINEMPRIPRAVMTTVFYAPALSGQAYTVFQLFFGADRYGIFNGWLLSLGLLKEPVAWLQDTGTIMTVLIVTQLWLSLGSGFLAFIAGFQGVDPSLFDACAIDGVRNRFQELWYVTLPSMKSQMLFSAVMQIVSAFTVADISVQLVGFPSTEYAGETLVTHIMDYGSTRYEMGYACALAAFVFALMLVMNKLVTLVIRRVGH